mgnify:CR=1 FL=1
MPQQTNQSAQKKANSALEPRAKGNVISLKGGAIEVLPKPAGPRYPADEVLTGQADSALRGLSSESVDHVDTVTARRAKDDAGITQRAEVDAPLTVLFIGQILAPC